MKKPQFIILIFFSCGIYAQNSLFIDFEIEKNPYKSDYHLYKNDTLVYTNCNKKNDFEKLFKLERGRYFIKYNTIYGIDSLYVEFNSNNESKFITLNTESIDSLTLKNTKSEIELLKDNEKITLKYSLGGCFVSKNEEIILTKNKNRYYKIKNGKRKNISKKKIKDLINYEKTLRNLNINENIDKTFWTSTCSEYILIEKNEEVIYSKNIYCGDWSKSSEIEKWIK